MKKLSKYILWAVAIVVLALAYAHTDSALSAVSNFAPAMLIAMGCVGYSTNFE